MDTTHYIRVAEHRTNPGLLWSALLAYASKQACVLRWYDMANLGPVQAAGAIDLIALGRLHFTGTGLTADQADELLRVEPSPLLNSIAESATLAEADPSNDGGLYDAAEAAHRAYLAVNRHFGPTLVSATLALLRPHLFPILTPAIRMLYEATAERAWTTSVKVERPFSRRTYWPVIREDLMRARTQIDEWRTELSASEIETERWLANVSDVRLWGIATQALAAGTVPGTV